MDISVGPAQQAGLTPLAGGAPVAWGALAGAFVWRAGSSILAVARERTVGTPATFCTNTVTVDAFRVKEGGGGIYYCIITYYLLLHIILYYYIYISTFICVYTWEGETLIAILNVYFLYVYIFGLSNNRFLCVQWLQSGWSYQSSQWGSDNDQWSGDIRRRGCSHSALCILSRRCRPANSIHTAAAVDLVFDTFCCPSIFTQREEVDFTRLCFQSLSLSFSPGSGGRTSLLSSLECTCSDRPARCTLLRCHTCRWGCIPGPRSHWDSWWSSPAPATLHTAQSISQITARGTSRIGTGLDVYEVKEWFAFLAMGSKSRERRRWTGVEKRCIENQHEILTFRR